MTAKRDRYSKESKIANLKAKIVTSGAGMEPAGAGRHRTKPRSGERAGTSESIEPAGETTSRLSTRSARDHEAGAGIEPANSGFADRSLTTWLPRRLAEVERNARRKRVNVARTQTGDFRRETLPERR